MNSQLHFNFHGVPVLFEGPPTVREVLENLLQDFGFFEVAQPLKPKLIFRLALEGAPKKRPRTVRLFKTKMGTAYRSFPSGRLCDYGDGTQVHSHFEPHNRIFYVQSPDAQELYEATYMAALSAVGEALDHQGYHRVHALGFQPGTKNVLLILPQGGGKSALAALLRGPAHHRFFSDEIPLLRNGQLHPFPIRMALKPNVAHALNIPTERARLFRRKIFPEKLLFSFQGHEVAQSRPLDFILVGQKISGDMPRIQRQSRISAFWSLFKTMTIGLGVPQMAEHMLRRNARIPQIFVSRLREAVVSARRSEVYRFQVVADARKNAQVLHRFLESKT